MARITPFFLFSLLFVTFILTSCTLVDTDKRARLTLEKKPFSALAGWETDALDQSLKAFEKSCNTILKRDMNALFKKELPYAGLNKDWQQACRALLIAYPQTIEDTRAFYEEYFTPYAIYANADEEGLFTGYYEASLNGSLTQTSKYSYPLYKRPDDLVMVDLGNFRDELKGQRIAGRVINAHLKPFEDRTEIEAGALKGQGLELVYVDDPIAAFFLQIQGSGRITLPDGSHINVGYDGQNGHPYHAIGRTLIQKGVLTKETVSLQTIRQWLEDNPDEAQAVKNTNPSFVFFKKLENEGPLGGSGLALTAGRSIAIDYTYIPYHAPVFIDVENPLPQAPRLQRLLIAQDTGGAIRGPVRGDVFWGHGEYAEDVAGIMKSKGKAWILLPKSVIIPPHYIQ